jgi:hypothetical protein
MRPAAWLLLPLLAGCGIPEHSPMMRPGEDCLACHGDGDRLHWYAAGTVYLALQPAADEGVQGAKVVITDGNGRQISLTTNGAGNFYTAETLAFPATVQVWRGGNMNEMPGQAPEGGCNRCHNGTPSGGAQGRIYAP